MKNPKTRRSINLEKKLEIITEAAKNVSKLELSRIFNLPRQSIQGILKDREKILAAIEAGYGKKRSRLRAAKNTDIESALVNWIRQKRSHNIPMTGDLIKGKAIEIAAELGSPEFKGSIGWLSKFKRRNSIVFRTNQGQAADINMEALNEWQQEVLRIHLERFTPENVFNIDETALRYKLMPNKTLAFKGEVCTASQAAKAKTRVTVLVGANMSGNEKIPLLVIGKYKRPRCFKRQQRPPLTYAANQNAWMNTPLFIKWMTKWNTKLKRTGRKILVYMDNCSAHPADLELSNIEIKFLPPNTTAKSQPMDQGIIQNLKVHYKKELLRKRIDHLDAGRDFDPDLKQAMRILKHAWGHVKQETIRNCFKEAGFVSPEMLIDEPTDEDEFQVFEELAEQWDMLRIRGDLEDDSDLMDYIEADDDLETAAIDNTPMEHAPALANIEDPLVEPAAQADAIEMQYSSDYEEWFMENGMPAEPINYDQYLYLLDD